MKVFLLITEVSDGDLDLSHYINVYGAEEKALEALNKEAEKAKSTLKKRFGDDDDALTETKTETSYYVNSYDGDYIYIEVIEKEVK